MLSQNLVGELETAARQVLGTEFRVEAVSAVGGGDINTAVCLRGPHAKVFAKLRPAGDLAMFKAEAEGLRALAQCAAIRVPLVLACAEAGDRAYLLLEWLDIQPLHDSPAADRAGEALAELHRCTRAEYGWNHDNFIGSTLQRNFESINWASFFITARLRPQFEMAAAHGFGANLLRQAESIYAKLPALFLEYRPTASLLHGDLWSGNFGSLADGSPVLFDPACYYGDRETDLAMTELFGGLPLAFYAAYRRSWPLHPDYERRKPVYNLYHILNHLNLFGRSYLGQAERLTAQLARELGR